MIFGAPSVNISKQDLRDGQHSKIELKSDQFGTLYIGSNFIHHSNSKNIKIINVSLYLSTIWIDFCH